MGQSIPAGSSSSCVSQDDKRVPPVPLVSVVVPVYNEGDQVLENCFRDLLATLEDFGKTWEIIFIDDFSMDDSLQKLLSFLERDSRVKVVEHSRNLGAVQAILSGLKFSSGEIVIPFDPDLQFAPECIPQLSGKVMEGYDFAGGVRVNRNDNFLKKLTSRLGSYAISLVMGVRQKDFGSIKAYSRRTVDGILSLPQDYMSIQAAAFTLSKHFVEIPIEHRPREIGESKWTFMMRLEYFMDVFTSYASFPFSAVLIFGLLMTLAGFGMSLLGAYRILSGQSPDLVLGVLVWLSLTCLLFGGIFMTLALIGKFVVRGFRRKFLLGEDSRVRILHTHVQVETQGTKTY